MFSQIASFLVYTVVTFFVFLLLLRFHFQWLRVPFRNPFGEFVLQTTSWMVMPVRRVIPGLAGLDLATLLLAWIIQALGLWVQAQIRGVDPSVVGLVFGALVDLVRYSLYILVAAVMFYTGQEHTLEKPIFLQFPADPLLNERRVLIVDDVWDSGRTIMAVRERVLDAGGYPETAVLHYKPRRTAYSDVRPTYYVDETDAWIVYPWDVGEANLLHRLVVLVQVLRDVLRIDDRHDRVELESLLHLVVGEKRLRDGRRVREAGREGESESRGAGG